MPTNQDQDRISNGAQPWATRREVIQYAPSAVISWQNEAQTREVSLCEHDSAIVALLALRDYVARPRSTGAPSARASIIVNPYATVPYFDAQANNGAGAWVAIPAVGVYPQPSETEAQKWWDALDALVWRIADLTTENAATGAVVLPADATPVAVFGPDTDATVTMPGRKFHENAETVRLVAPIAAGALAFAEQQARGAAALSAAQNAAISGALATRDLLAKERATVSTRGNWRAFGTLAVVAAGSYAVSRM